MTSSKTPVEQTLSPITVNDFIGQYWEQKPLHIARDDTSHFQHLVSTRAIEALLTGQDVYFPQVQATQSGVSIPMSDYADTDQKILPLRLLNLHGDGATVILSQANRLLASLDAFCRAMHETLQKRCQANVYLSPPACQGFNPHYDSHDVFILQVAGQKTFRFYAGGRVLPLNSQRFEPDDALLGERKTAITLNAGDTLYIPRGMMHDAIAEGSEPSLHVTLGVFTATFHDLMHEAVNHAVASEPQLRQSLSLFDDTAASLSESLLQTMTSVLSVETVTDALYSLQKDFVIGLPQDCDGQLQRIQAANTVNCQQTLVLRTSQIVALHEYENTTDILCNGQVLTFHGETARAVAWLYRHTSAVIDAIPELTAELQIDLARRLLRENLADVRPVT